LVAPQEGHPVRCCRNKFIFGTSRLTRNNLEKCSVQQAPCEQILTKFCTFGDVPDVVIRANFGMEKLRGLGNTGGQNLGSPIETTGHPYNSVRTACDHLASI